MKQPPLLNEVTAAPDLREHLSAELVAEYLLQHPDFFLQHESVLAELNLPHHKGDNTVSLVERQVSTLRARNSDMRQRLHSLLEAARDNDALFQKTQWLILSLLEAENGDNLIERLLEALRDHFLVDACDFLAVAEANLPTRNYPRQTLESLQRELGSLCQQQQPICGQFKPMELAVLFPQATQPIRSAAVLPIRRAGELLGFLAIGSFDPNDYHAGMGTLFLGYVGEVMSRLLTAR